MKHFLLVASLATIFFANSCTDINPEGNKEYDDIPLTKTGQEIVNQSVDFSINFFKKTNEYEKGSNFLVSPLSLSIALSMVANGAEGETYNEIVSTIGLKDFSLDEVNDFYEEFIEDLEEADSKVKFRTANSAWIANGFPVKSSYKNKIIDSYNAEVQNIDFTSEKSVKTLNKWCYNKTDGMIDKMFSTLNPDTKMMIINALLFDGKWAKEFDESDTYDETFKSISGDKTMKFMHHTFSNVKVEINDDVHMCSIPYGNGAYSMVIAMPANESSDFNAFVKSITSEKWNKWISTMSTPEETVLKMPKFKGNYTTEDKLVPILKSMGINRAFTIDAQFAGISEMPLYISNGRQNTAIEVDESGTKAAAITVFDMRCTSAGPGAQVIFNVDRPFVYAIRESSTNAILFIGTKVN